MEMYLFVVFSIIFKPHYMIMWSILIICIPFKKDKLFINRRIPLDDRAVVCPWKRHHYQSGRCITQGTVLCVISFVRRNTENRPLCYTGRSMITFHQATRRRAQKRPQKRQKANRRFLISQAGAPRWPACCAHLSMGKLFQFFLILGLTFYLQTVLWMLSCL